MLNSKLRNSDMWHGCPKWNLSNYVNSCPFYNCLKLCCCTWTLIKCIKINVLFNVPPKSFFKLTLVQRDFMHSISAVLKRQHYYPDFLPLSIHLLPSSLFISFWQRCDFNPLFTYRLNSPLTTIINKRKIGRPQLYRSINRIKIIIASQYDHFISMCFFNSMLNIIYQRILILFVLLRLAYFTKQNDFQLHSFCCKRQNFKFL